jgi:hypothetical protein
MVCIACSTYGESRELNHLADDGVRLQAVAEYDANCIYSGIDYPRRRTMGLATRCADAYSDPRLCRNGNTASLATQSALMDSQQN